MEQKFTVLPFSPEVIIGFVRDSLIVDEEDLSATLTIRILNGTLGDDTTAVVEFSTENGTALCM